MHRCVCVYVRECVRVCVCEEVNLFDKVNTWLDAEFQACLQWLEALLLTTPLDWNILPHLRYNNGTKKKYNFAWPVQNNKNFFLYIHAIRVYVFPKSLEKRVWNKKKNDIRNHCYWNKQECET